MSDFAVVVAREEGRWGAALLPEAVIDDLGALVGALRQQPGEGGVIGLVNVADEFFVVVRVVAGETRILLSDSTAAVAWDLAGQVLDWLEIDRPGEDDLDDVWPAGDMSIFATSGSTRWSSGCC